ncbi:MAG: hypothetical protein ACI4RR_05180, partial [Eubacterium sp.]
MKKSILLFIGVILLISIIFAACSAKNETEDVTSSDADVSSTDGLDSADNYEYGLETQTVTDKDGNKITTEVAVVYKTDKSGNTYAQKLDENGKEVTDKKGNPVTIKTKITTTKAENASTTNKNTEASKNDNNTTKATQPANSTTTAATNKETTATTKKNIDLTKESQTTKFDGEEIVPKTSDEGTPVNFSEKDQETIANMLEVPYLYLNSYENADGVPIEQGEEAIWHELN